MRDTRPNSGALATALEFAIRTRVQTVALEHQRREIQRYFAELAELGIPTHPELLPSRPMLPPLAAVEELHVAGVMGLCFDGLRKPVRHLEISSRRLGRIRAAAADAVHAWFEPPPGASKRVMRMLIVEDDEELARAFRRCVDREAERLGRRLHCQLVACTRPTNPVLNPNESA